MAQCWIDSRDDWSLMRLQGQAYRVTGRGEQPLVPLGDPSRPPCQPLLVCQPAGRAENWLLLAPPGTAVLVNGVLMRLGLRHLRDRDEVLWADESAGPTGTRFFFSTERLAEVTPLPHGPRPVFCVRCKQLIEPASPAVQCPCATCGMWHHQTPELECWTYAEHCAMCDQPTALDAGFRWTPLEI